MGCVNGCHIQSIYFGRYKFQVCADFFSGCIGPLHEMVTRQCCCCGTCCIICHRCKCLAFRIYASACCCFILDGNIRIFFKMGCVNSCHIHSVYLGRHICRVFAHYIACCVGPFYKMVTGQRFRHGTCCITAYRCKGFIGWLHSSAFCCPV